MLSAQENASCLFVTSLAGDVAHTHLLTHSLRKYVTQSNACMVIGSPQIMSVTASFFGANAILTTQTETA